MLFWCHFLNCRIFKFFCSKKLTVKTDICKAFHRILHSVLLKKLSRMGIHSSMLTLTKAYQINRLKIVKVVGWTSIPINLTSLMVLNVCWRLENCLPCEVHSWHYELTMWFGCAFVVRCHHDYHNHHYNRENNR